MRWKLQEDSAEAEGESVLFDCSERGVEKTSEFDGNG